MKSSTKIRKRLFIIIFGCFAAIILIGLCTFFGIYFSAKLDKDKIVAERAQVTLLDVRGNEIDSSFLNRYVTYEDIGTDIINAFVALEDKRFFTHKGVDYYRTAGAMLNNIKAGYFKEGGSTITQQLAKNTQLTNEKTLIRKIKEMKLSRDIERNYSKEQILEMYLNAIYYGNGIYGIDSACKTYFDKSPSELSVAESAILAGIVKSPQAYSPVNNPEKAESRMRLVLRLMFEQGFLNEAEYEEALQYKYIAPKSDNFSPYLSAVIGEACEKLNLTETEIIKSPIKIYTYYDAEAQKILNDAYSSGEYKIETKDGSEAYVSVTLADNDSGGIIAYFSNKKFNTFKFRRQPGSTIKPLIVYAPALNEYRITEADEVVDERTDFNGYYPSNYRDNYIGKTDIETALKNSINTIAVKTYSENNRELSLNILKNMGMTLDERDNNLSLALGGMTYGSTAPELIESYMTLANGGEHSECGFIRKIIDDKKVIYQKSDAKKRVLNDDSAFIVTDMLIKTAKDGTAKKLASLDYEVAAKTGTVSGIGGKNSDAWCVSYTTENTMCVWYGGADYSENQTINATGGGMPTLLTKDLYRAMKKPLKYKFEEPDSVIELEIDAYAREKEGKLYLTNIYTPTEYRKKYYFSVRNCPNEISKYFMFDGVNFLASNENGIIKLNFEKRYPYSYKIFRKNLNGNISETVYEYSTDISDCLLNNNVFVDTSVKRGETYSYTLEIYYNGALVGISQSNLVLTS